MIVVLVLLLLILTVLLLVVEVLLIIAVVVVVAAVESVAVTGLFVVADWYEINFIFKDVKPYSVVVDIREALSFISFSEVNFSDVWEVSRLKDIADDGFDAFKYDMLIAGNVVVRFSGIFVDELEKLKSIFCQKIYQSI